MPFGPRGERGYAAYYRTDTNRRHCRAAPVFAVLRSWAAGILVLAAASTVLSTVLPEQFGSPERLESFGWRLALLYVPTALANALTAFFAARVHPEPYRRRVGQHLFAVLGVPLAAHLYGLGQHWGTLVPQGVLLSTLSVGAGCFVAVVIDLVWDRADAG